MLQHSTSHLFTKPGAYKVDVSRGVYVIKCWGAAGGNLSTESSKGAFVSGVIFLHEDISLYIQLSLLFSESL